MYFFSLIAFGSISLMNNNNNNNKEGELEDVIFDRRPVHQGPVGCQGRKYDYRVLEGVHYGDVVQPCRGEGGIPGGDERGERRVCKGKI